MNTEDVVARCIPDDGLPWLPLAPYAELVSVKLLSVDTLRGEVILLLRAPPGIELPRHRTSGVAYVYTLQGRWKYREYDWVAGPGALVIEPASSSHTVQVLGDGTDDAMMLVRLEGDLHLVDDAGSIASTENWRTAIARYLDFCRINEMPARDLTARAGSNPTSANGARIP